MFLGSSLRKKSFFVFKIFIVFKLKILLVMFKSCFNELRNVKVIITCGSLRAGLGCRGGRNRFLNAIGWFIVRTLLFT